MLLRPNAHPCAVRIAAGARVVTDRQHDSCLRLRVAPLTAQRIGDAVAHKRIIRLALALVLRRRAVGARVLGPEAEKGAGSEKPKRGSCLATHGPGAAALPPARPASGKFSSPSSYVLWGGVVALRALARRGKRLYLFPCRCGLPWLQPTPADAGQHHWTAI